MPITLVGQIQENETFLTTDGEIMVLHPHSYYFPKEEYVCVYGSLTKEGFKIQKILYMEENPDLDILFNEILGK